MHLAVKLDTLNEFTLAGLRLMRVVLDACVLFPVSVRKILLGVAEKRLFTPLWSEKILDEWQFATAKSDKKLFDQTKVEILLLKSYWDESLIPKNEEVENQLILPDMNDRHVLATAITGKAEILLTNNLRDFPSRVLGKYGIIPRSPDNFLLEIYYIFPDLITVLTKAAFESARECRLNITSEKLFLKRSGLLRLAKHLKI